MTFSTPSTLKHHLYTHASHRFFCRCCKGYHFLAELKVHKLTHHRIKTAICTYPGCDKSYFSQADLAKHARTHKNITWMCQDCDYRTPDERLLKSQQRKHTQTIRYTCSTCGKGFVYNSQWAHHKTSSNCTPLKCSDSPEL